ncbi:MULTISPECIES: O-methyltransferase [unclassified Lentimicrobium]|uniref:O-methyltransferase n=1 Tax=unclassified Lentimicrobium TaxID=2677434 RepID=UPI0015561623|nr:MULTISPECIES: O-methyltransferase [unclassified Lentimicrobium]NPD44031.1 methyltransferase domain-containing protein [Lentimicrobium sp. S6]NPD84055.1 methyltransferase domain-containing protein [Lentimicrobium sp. L6]
MNLLPDSIENYINDHSSQEDQLLYELYRETNLKTTHPRMLSGSVQGQFLQMLANLIHAESILEIGTFTGYSAICLARGMKAEGKLHTIDIKEEFSDIANKYIKRAGFENKITQHIGDALDIIPQINEEFDLIFIDADKLNYPKYFELVAEKMSTGGLLIVDNVLWSGKVVKKLKTADKDTRGVLEFNKKIQEDGRFENTLIPLRDGLMLARKK